MRQALEVIRLRLQQIWGYLTLHLFDETARRIMKHGHCQDPAGQQGAQMGRLSHRNAAR